MAHVNRKEYWIIFVWLFVLTVIEVAVAQIPGISRGLLVSSLVLLAVAKAVLVGLFYMHLKYEGKLIWAVILSPVFLAAVICIGFWPDAVGYYARS